MPAYRDSRFPPFLSSLSLKSLWNLPSLVSIDTHLLKALQHGCINESALNQTYFSKSIGNVIKYGDVVQLKHKKSGKFITVTTTKTAEFERENLVVLLQEGGEALSWMTILPKLKIDQEGHGAQRRRRVLPHLGPRQRVLALQHKRDRDTREGDSEHQRSEHHQHKNKGDQL
jgi:hypothetical protein